MHKFCLYLLSLLLIGPVFADESIEPLLNKVTFQLNAEQWVTSKTALVNISINAAVSDKSLEKIHSQVLEKLKQLSNKDEWHLVTYDRAQDKSGLEAIQIMAQARLPDVDLVGLREKAKAISKAGETYTIESIQFIPSDDELRNANSALRTNIYEQAKAELERINKIYPEQKYYLHDINFINAAIPMAAQTTFSKMSENSNLVSRSAAPIAVGDKLRVSAIIVLSTMPEQNILRAVRN